MKKKILTIAMFVGMMFVLASCDFLSSLIAVKGFYEEYQEYSAIYSETTKYTVLNETDLSVSTTDIADLENISSRVYVMIDQESTFMYVEQTLGEISKNSLYENTGDLYIEYLIEDMIVTPTLPAAEDRFENTFSGNILNENFNYQDVSGEIKTDTHTYELDVYLNQALNLDVLSDFINQLEIFGADLSVFDNAVAHIVITFASEDSTIDVTVTLTDYTITFEDQSYVTLSLTNHTVLQVPDDFAFPDVFNDPYQMKAVDNILLARRIYEANDTILYPALSGESGWVQISLEEGTYGFDSTDPLFTFMMYDTDGNEVGVLSDNGYMRELTVTGDAQSFYLYISTLADTDVSISIVQIDDSGNVVTTETTTVPVTTETTTVELTDAVSSASE